MRPLYRGDIQTAIKLLRGYARVGLSLRLSIENGSATLYCMEQKNLLVSKV